MLVDHNNPEEPSQRHRRERTKEEMGNRHEELKGLEQFTLEVIT